MTYDFTREQLNKINFFFNGVFGPVDAYRWYHKLDKHTPTVTEEVEDFSCAFMSQYNKTFGLTF